MNHDLYELIALFMRHVFWALMLLIVLRAVRITMVDARCAAKLRHLSPMTGICGELLVLEGDERARKGMRYPVIREGMIGTSRSADVRIRHSSLRRRHAYFQLMEDGLHLRGHAGARLRNSDGELVRDIVLADGDDVGIGRVHLLLILTEATGAAEIRLVDRAPDDDFDFEPAPRRIRFETIGEPGETTVRQGISRNDPDALFRTPRPPRPADPFDNPVAHGRERDPFDDFDAPSRSSETFDPFDAPTVRKKTAKKRSDNDLFHTDNEEDW